MQPGTSETRLGSSPSHSHDAVGFAPGAILSDRYRVVALVGRGGMGEVYRADDLRLGQQVALKFLPVRLEQDQAARDRLIAEVRNARAVSHPNVCRVYDIGEVQGRYFLTMEYIDGEDLASLLRRIGRLPTGKALEVARQLCAGLIAAHERGVLHRDLKPANVMIDGRGQARITDFGLAVELADAGAAGQRGARGLVEVAGTIAYMAPERFEGKPATVQSDLYSLGLVLYEVYTGKPAISATTLDGWRRAHIDSAPSHPSTIVTDIEPAVERAILRCLEKDPSKRPSSVAQLVTALPGGGDPLAAAIAAGETPSPELVAASGEEGTLPRKEAWLWFLVSLAALVLAVPLGSLWQLANVVPLKEPAIQRAAARELLSSIGYRNAPVDNAVWFVADVDYLASLVRNRPPGEWFRDAAAKRGAILFCYRESPIPLFAWNPSGRVGSVDWPAFRYPDDAYLQLDARGRIVFLRAGGLALRPAEPPPVGPVDWSRLFVAAGIDAATLKEAKVEWPAVVTADESRAWLGRVDGSEVRVEASAYRSRPVQFLVTSPEKRAPAGPRVPTRSRAFLVEFMAVTILVCLGVLAVLARHNLRIGRGDRKGAFRLAAAIIVVETLAVLLDRHWTFRPLNIAQVLVFLLGGPLFAGIQVWLFYMGAEPFLRRRWPHLLTAWTRLLDGRWRDPLVGRSLLTGAGTALFAFAIVPGILSALTRAFSLPLAVPRYVSGTLDGGLLWFLIPASSIWVGPVHMLLLVAVLLVARLVFRRDRPAWAALLLVTFALHMYDLLGTPGAAAAPLGSAIIAAVVSVSIVGATMREGVLAGAVCYTVMIAVYMTPLTYDLTCWYAWRTIVVVVLIASLAYWGFRNVLGRQSPFPAGALDE